MIIQMNVFHGINIHDNAFKLTFNKTLDFDIIDCGQCALLSVSVGNQVGCNS